MDNSNRTSVLKPWIPAFFIMGLIYLFSSVPGANIPRLFGFFDLVLLKGGHLTIYAVLAVAINFGIQRSLRNITALAWSAAVLFAVTDEFHQSVVTGRGPSVWDVG
ncbi:MAG: VanZ family protein, partial [Anaerolineales bacterium]|nr:VanZ family protein [Anaerolineales bacterium]